ncbi:entericidin A/B family lipoprotein [Halomonas sp. CKK8]|nr:entericidin A/B family lipoprotein [Halomonas sp. CKK8]WFM71632.1 entericidin A/B family lipoprotein [Halomonas sp. CKK8]
MKKAIAMSFMLLMTAGLLAGCNTLEGAGQDVEEGGEAVQDAAS